MRIFWPVTIAAAALVGLLAYGLVAKHSDTTLDDAVAKGKRPAAPVSALPWLQKTHDAIEAKGGVVLGLDTQDASASAIDFLKERKATFPSLRDKDRSYGREFGVTGYPETFLIDRKGRVAALQRMPVTQQWLDQHLPKLLAEQA